MYIVLTQLLEGSSYKDRIGSLYHFPKHYRKAISPGDVFVYYKADRHKPSGRYFYGSGVIGAIKRDPEDSTHYYAELADVRFFPQPVPPVMPSGGLYESLDYRSIRKSERPQFQSSVRRLSAQAYEAIMKAAGMDEAVSELKETAEVEAASQNWSEVLRRLNERYRTTVPAKRAQVTERYLDRGTAVTRALKEILGPICQICRTDGFRMRRGGRYIEAHHVTEVSDRREGSLCSDNVILVCPTCHRQLHHGLVTYESFPLHIGIQTDGSPQVRINRNTTDYLQALQAVQQAAVARDDAPEGMKPERPRRTRRTKPAKASTE